MARSAPLKARSSSWSAVCTADCASGSSSAVVARRARRWAVASVVWSMTGTAPLGVTSGGAGGGGGS